MNGCFLCVSFSIDAFFSVCAYAFYFMCLSLYVCVYIYIDIKHDYI